jgi:hypothetical protein
MSKAAGLLQELVAVGCVAAAGAGGLLAER